MKSLRWLESLKRRAVMAESFVSCRRSMWTSLRDSSMARALISAGFGTWDASGESIWCERVKG